MTYMHVLYAFQARLFCAEHFGDVPESSCVEHMMRNAQV